jgi:iron complex outermembrane receptor protein
MKNLSFAIIGGLFAAIQPGIGHTEEIEEIRVVSHPLSGEGLSQAVELIDGAELRRVLGSNIGSTLGKLPGIQNASFGKAVGRPVIHGLGGPRVKVMEDRIDSLDLSVTSADHAVGIDPFIAEKIEVLKGPSTLLYGSGAIGGVVDVHTGRIPHSMPKQGLTGGISTTFDSNTDGNATAAKLNGGIGAFAWHADFSIQDGDAYEIPGFAESAQLRAQEEAEEEAGGEAHDEEEEEARDVLPGSQFDSDNFALGGSFIQDWGFVGLVFSQLEANYGLPGGHGHEEEEGGAAGEEEAEGNPLLELEQNRVDFELGVIDPFSIFSSLNVRIGINDYEHQEIEPNGEVATEFSNEAWEARAELIYDLGKWRGLFGAQLSDRQFSALGEEAFVAPVDTDEQALFWVAERSFSQFDLELGARIGQLNHKPSANIDTDFNTYALSAGVVVPLLSNFQFGAVADYSSRAPVAEELYSDGPHLTTNSFEVGNILLDNEKAANIAATLEYNADKLSSRVTVYSTRFSDFIYQQATGAEEDGLPVVAYRQEDATYYGLDAELTAQLREWDGGQLELSLLLDWVNASLDVSGNDNIPRTPPLRFGVSALGQWGPATAELSYLRVDSQTDDVAPQEFGTDEYYDLNLYLGYQIKISEQANMEIFVHGKNLGDQEQRHHVSFIKDFAPAPGRTLLAGVRVNF